LHDLAGLVGSGIANIEHVTILHGEALGQEEAPAVIILI
jgi:hypothetical protein